VIRNDGIHKERITINNTEDILPNWSANNKFYLLQDL